MKLKYEIESSKDLNWNIFDAINYVEKCVGQKLNGFKGDVFWCY